VTDPVPSGIPALAPSERPGPPRLHSRLTAFEGMATPPHCRSAGPPWGPLSCVTGLWSGGQRAYAIVSETGSCTPSWLSLLDGK
jgi:hypothetical protein